jgi:UDP:flavonoid glycosyltransferase YjiC (YdhE family)
LELIRRAHLVITHGGMNTTMEALSQGKPLVAMPVTNDQPGVAARVAWNRCGQVVPARRATAGKLRQAARDVFSRASYRRAAEQQRQAIQQAGGLDAAADICEQAWLSGRPVPA